MHFWRTAPVFRLQASVSPHWPWHELRHLVLRQIKKLSAAHSSEISLQFLGTEVSNTESTSVLAALNILACLLTMKCFYIYRLVILFPVMHPALNGVGFHTVHLGHEMSKTSHKKRWATALVPVATSTVMYQWQNTEWEKTGFASLCCLRGSAFLHPRMASTYVYSQFLKLFHFAWYNKLLIEWERKRARTNLYRQKIGFSLGFQSVR